jgi:ectoine hydroxylase
VGLGAEVGMSAGEQRPLEQRPLEQEWLEQRATPEQLACFEREGYLVIPDALPPAWVDRLEAAVDRIDAEQRRRQGLAPAATMALFDAIASDPLFLALIDWPRTFPLAWDILGWNIQVYMSHLVVYPPEPAAVCTATRAHTWHQDGGMPVHDMERPHPRLSFKVGFWLSDTTAPDSGAMRIVPRSHHLDHLPLDDDGEPIAPVVALHVARGTAVLCDRRLFHARSANRSQTTRKSIFIGYGYRWLRGLDFNLHDPALLERCDPIRRQLLGDAHSQRGWWQPQPADVPLRAWMAEHGLVGPPPLYRVVPPGA